jgi:hypothetical protein
MLLEWTSLWSVLATFSGALAFLAGGFVFRRWAVGDRPGIPRFARPVETVVLWVLYSTLFSIGVIVLLQTLREA